MRKKKLNIASLIALAIILILGPLAYFRFIKPKLTTAAWFNDSWAYRTAITISNSGSADSNKKVKLDIDTATLYSAGKIKINCDDSRFTDANGKLLQYYLDSANGACNTNSTDYYVLIPTIYAGSTTIYHYYGNPSAVKGSKLSQFSQATFSQSATTTATEEQSKAPIAYWKMDEGQGTIANDATSNRNNGTLGTGSSAPTWQTEDMCVSGKCLKFDGSNDYVSVSNNNAINNMANATIELWVKFNNLSSAQIPITKDGDSGYYIQIETNGQPYLRYGTAVGTVGSAGDITAGSWIHLAMIFNSGTLKLYKNGIALSGSRTGSAPSGQNKPLFIGAYGSASLTIPSSYWVNGFIDEPKIYPYARTGAEIKTDYNARGTQKGVGVKMGSRKDNIDSSSGAGMTSGLVGYWKMDEASWNGTASEVIDSSGNANHGVGVGSTPPTTTAGKFGNAGSFDGAEDYVAITHNDILNANTAISVAFWMKAQDNSTNYSGMIGKNSNSDWSNKLGWSFNFPGNGKIQFVIGNSSSLASSITTSEYDDNNWHHVVGTWAGEKLKIFVDGSEAVYYSQGQTATSADSTSQVRFAEYAFDADERHYLGTLDEIRIYNRALSPAEVRNLYNWAPGPVAYYNFNEGVGSSAYDTSGYGNNGVLGTGSSAPTWTTGKFGKGLKFDGSNDYVSIASDDTDFSLDPYRKMSFSAYIKANSYSDLQAILSRRHPCNNNGHFDIYVSGNDLYFSFYSNLDVGTVTYYTNADVLTNGKMYHIEWVKEWGVNNGTKLYLNGVGQTLTTSGTDNLRGASYGGLILYIGARNVASSGCPNTPTSIFNGTIDEVKIYNYLRTQKQIVEDMNAGHPAVGSPIGSAIAKYSFDEGYGATTNNSGFGGLGLLGTLGTGSSSPSWTNDGKFGKALSFDGNDWVSFPDMGY